MLVHTHVCFRRQEFVVAVPSAGLAYVSVFECTNMCDRSKQSSAVAVPVTATVQTCVSYYKESVRGGCVFTLTLCCKSKEFVVMPWLVVTF